MESGRAPLAPASYSVTEIRFDYLKTALANDWKNYYDDQPQNEDVSKNLQLFAPLTASDVDPAFQLRSLTEDADALAIASSGGSHLRDKYSSEV